MPKGVKKVKPRVIRVCMLKIYSPLMLPSQSALISCLLLSVCKLKVSSFLVPPCQKALKSSLMSYVWVG